MTDDIAATARQDRDGSVTITTKIPPPPEWATVIDSAFERLHEFEHDNPHWHFVSLSVPSYLYGYICVLEKKAVTHSMSGSAGLAGAVAGFGPTQVAAIDGAIAWAKHWDAGHDPEEDNR